jgi:hypothetical protein
MGPSYNCSSGGIQLLGAMVNDTVLSLNLDYLSTSRYHQIPYNTSSQGELK